MHEDDPTGAAPPSDRALISKVHVVDGRSLTFTETGAVREDSWDIGWEATPAFAERADESDRSEDSGEPTPMPALPSFGPRRAPAPAPAPAAAPAPAPVARPRPQLGGEGSLETMPAIFEGLRPGDLQAAIGHFDVLDLHTGETLIGEGERHPALVMILRGQLEALRQGQRRRVGSGEALGLTTLFGTGVWPNTLRTLSECRLMVLELEGFRALRAAGDIVALTIEEYALETFLDALQRTARRTAELVKPVPLAELVPPPPLLARMAAAFGLGGVGAASVDVQAALLASPLFRNAEAAQVAELAGRMAGVRAQPGEYLITPEQPSTKLYVVVSGAVDVLTVSRDRAVKHGTLGSGDLLGAWSMLRATPDWAWYVTTERTTLLELDKMAWAELATARHATGSVLRLAVLRALARRLHVAGARLAALEGGRPAAAPAEESPFVTMMPTDRR